MAIFCWGKHDDYWSITTLWYKFILSILRLKLSDKTLFTKESAAYSPASRGNVLKKGEILPNLVMLGSKYLNKQFHHIVFKLYVCVIFNTLKNNKTVKCFLMTKRFLIRGGEVSKTHQLVMGFPRDRFLDPSSSPHTLHHWVPSYRHMASPTISTLMTHSSISLSNQMIQR